MRLENQVAIVTGAGRNIGEDVAKLFVQEGAKVAVVDLDPGAAAASPRNQCDESGQSHFRSVRTWRRQVPSIRWCKPSSKHSAASIFWSITLPGPTQDAFRYQRRRVDRVMNICLRSVWYCTRAAAKVMIDKNARAKIINIASTSGHWGRKEATAYTTRRPACSTLPDPSPSNWLPRGFA